MVTPFDHVIIINLALAFIEGFALIISPCILPILPLIFAGSITGSKKYAFGVIIGFILSFALFTFFSRALVHHLGIDIAIIRYISYALLIALGVVMMSDYLSEKFSGMTESLARISQRAVATTGTSVSFFSGIFFGSLVGLIWTPCAGPILASAIVQTIAQKTTIAGFFVMLSF